MAQKKANVKKNNKTTVTVISVIAALVIVAAAIVIFIWARGNAPKDPSDSAKIEVSDTATEKATENTNVVTQPEDETSGEVSESDETTDETTEEESTEPEETIPVSPDDAEVTIEHQSSEASEQLPDGNTITLDIDAPKMVSDSYGENVSKFNGLISTEVEELKNAYAQTVANPEENGGEDMSISMSFDVFKNDSGIVSVLLKNEYYLGGAHEETVYKAVNYELNGGNRLTLGDILVVDKETYTKFIKDFVLTEMRKDPEKYYSTEDGALDGLFDESQFYITNKGIVVYFQQYDISPFAEGLPTFEITYADMAPLMAY